MAERKTVSLNQAQINAMENMESHGDADNQSEAFRTALNVGFSELGYLNGNGETNTPTTLQRATREMSKLFLYFGVALLGFTWFYPVSLRLIAVAPVVSGVFLLGVERVLEIYEPSVSDSMARVFKRGEKA